MDRPEVWVTGLGVVSAAGAGVKSTLSNLESGIRRTGPVTIFKTRLEYPVFEVEPTGLAQHPSLSRSSRLLLLAVSEALAMSGLSSPPPEDTGLCFGTTVASQLNDIDFYATYRKTGRGPLASLKRYLQGNLAELVGREYEIHGPQITVTNACASGTDALGLALSWIRSGRCTTAIAGGADELSLLSYAGFAALGAASLQPCAPFDKHRSGLNLGEGAGVLLLERADVARARNACPLSILRGYGNASDSYHLTAPHPSGAGLEKAVRKALSDSGIEPGAIDFVNAHGTATRENDSTEANALARIFGTRIPILSTKGYTGHTLGAAGGIEAVFTVLSLIHGWAPACAGFGTQDESIPFTPPTAKTPVRRNAAVSVSAAFGGVNSAIVLAAAQSSRPSGKGQA